jgi:hypothetical protein
MDFAAGIVLDCCTIVDPTSDKLDDTPVELVIATSVHVRTLSARARLIDEFPM